MIIFLKSQNLIAKLIKFGGKNFASVSEWLVFAYTESGNFTRNSSAYTHTYISIYLYRYIYLSIDRLSQIKKPLEKYFLCSFLSKKIYKLF